MKRNSQEQARHDTCDLRVDELLRACEAFRGAGRKIPGHVIRQLVFLRKHWGRRSIPNEVVMARPLIEREFTDFDEIGIVSGRSGVGATGTWEQDER
jgi:hypothetical protein